MIINNEKFKTFADKKTIRKIIKQQARDIKKNISPNDLITFMVILRAGGIIYHNLLIKEFVHTHRFNVFFTRIFNNYHVYNGEKQSNGQSQLHYLPDDIYIEDINIFDDRIVIVFDSIFEKNRTIQKIQNFLQDYKPKKVFYLTLVDVEDANKILFKKPFSKYLKSKKENFLRGMGMGDDSIFDNARFLEELEFIKTK